MAEPRVFVSPPQRQPRRGGIKSVVDNFITTQRLGAAGAVEWVSEGCGLPQIAPGLCYQANAPTGDKTFEGIEVGTGPIFALYAGVECFLGPNQDYDRRASALLDAGEDRGVEEALWEWATTTVGTAAPGTTWPQSIGALEEEADQYYVGMPVIMMARNDAVAARAARAIFGDEEGNLWTANGTPVIASATASSNHAVIIGFPTVYASGSSVIQTTDHTLNKAMAIAERIYAIAVDCAFARYVNVTTP